MFSTPKPHPLIKTGHIQHTVKPYMLNTPFVASVDSAIIITNGPVKPYTWSWWYYLEHIPNTCHFLISVSLLRATSSGSSGNSFSDATTTPVQVHAYMTRFRFTPLGEPDDTAFGLSFYSFNLCKRPMQNPNIYPITFAHLMAVSVMKPPLCWTQIYFSKMYLDQFSTK